ncbi:MAG: hypothetical protein K0R85_665 [Devosia sp.]|jgi:hypothetical protein|nr:hypothetical protein [Devosia sp.]
MSKHLPPVPPANRSPKGPGGEATLDPNTASAAANGAERNYDQQGRQGNIKQNTTNQGLQHDR